MFDSNTVPARKQHRNVANQAAGESCDEYTEDERNEDFHNSVIAISEIPPKRLNSLSSVLLELLRGYDISDFRGLLDQPVL